MTPIPPPAGFLTVQDACTRLGVSRNRGYLMVKLELLPALRVDGQLFIPETAVDARLEELRQRNECITTDDVLEFFGIARRTLYHWIHIGLLNPTRRAGVNCYDLDEIVTLTPPSRSRAHINGEPTRMLRGVHYPEPEIVEVAS